MKKLKLFIGLLVVAGLAAGIYFAYAARTAQGDGPPGEEAERGEEGEGDGVVVFPHVTGQDGSFVTDEITVQVKIDTRPIKASEENRYRFSFIAEIGEALSLDEGVLKFSMEGMDMGRHNYVLQPDEEDGWYVVEAAIPACPSGGTLWHGTLEFTIDGARHEGGFSFDLEP